MSTATLYDRVGGQAWFDRLVDRFYEGVETDPVLRPLYPDDLEPGKHHLALFFGQYWGGPPAYNEQRGHPRLRARHLPFPIGEPERNAWVRHMTAALATADDLDDDDRQAFLDYIDQAATFMINTNPLGLIEPS